MTSPILQLVQRACSANRRWLLAAIAYFVLRTLYGLADEGAGPLSPSGHIDLLGVLLLFVVLALRLIVLFVVPAVLVYRLVRWQLLGRAGPGSR